MKIRSGFVSNSSSSSFIVSNFNRLQTTAQVALLMLDLVAQDYLTFDDISKVPDDISNALKWLTDNIDYDKPITFPWSINETTFIWKNDNGVCVDTCNNHHWSEIIDYEYVGDDWQFDEKPWGNQQVLFKDSCDSFLDLSNMEVVDHEYCPRNKEED